MEATSMRDRCEKSYMILGLCILFLILGLAYNGQFSTKNNQLIKLILFEIENTRNRKLLQPDFVDFYAPFPTENLEDFLRKDDMVHSRGIRITMTPKFMDFTSETCDEDNLYSRVELYIDDIAILNDSLKIAVASDGYYCRLFEFTFSWLPNLQAGQHDAEFRIKDDSNHIWSYSWQFSLVK